MTARKAPISLAGSPAYHPPAAVAGHAAKLERRQAKAARDRDAGAPPEVLAGHETEIVRLTKAVRRSQRRVDRLAVLRLEQADRAETRADNDELRARLAAKEAAEDEAAKGLCLAVIGRIQARAAEGHARRKLETREDRRKASLRRRNPHTERDAAIKPGRRIIMDPARVGKLVEVQVNRQLDVLTMERSGHRISEQEFAVGRLLQAAWVGDRSEVDGRLDRLADLGILPGGGSGDDLTSREMGMLRQVFRARAVSELDARLAGVVGWIGVRFLKAILVEGHTLATYAACTVGGGKRGGHRVGDRFRWLLEEVTNHLHTAKGGLRYTPRDEHLAASDTVAARVEALGVKQDRVGRMGRAAPEALPA